MKIKHTYLILLVFILFGLAGCSNNSEESSASKDTNTESVSDDRAVDVYSESILDLSSYELNDNESPDFIWNYCASADSGYYYGRNNFLYFYDIETATEVPLCNRADCSHIDETCNACFISDAVNLNNIVYYDGYIYLVSTKSSTGDIFLSRISEDGSTCELEYMTLYQVAAESEGTFEVRYPNFIIHRDYVYYIISNETVPKVYRMKLGTSDREIVYTSSGTRPNVYRIIYNGDFIFFQSGNFSDDNYIDIDAGIFAYNTVNGEVALVKNGPVSTYDVQNETIYYYSNSAIHAYSLRDGNETILIEDNKCDLTDFTVIGESLYLWDDEENILTIYDLNGEEIIQVSNENISSCFYGDSRYFIGDYLETANSVTYYCVLNIDDALAGIGKWTIIQ